MEPQVVSALDAAVTASERRQGIVVGVSGGADSVAMARALRHLQGAEEWPLVVAHLDHALRPSSASDAEWVRHFAGSLGMDAVIERHDVRGFADAHNLGVEEGARRCRYAFLSRIAVGHNCRYIAVGHTSDDQAETILHHVIRGTGLAGLQGMPASRQLEGCTLIRPLLGVSRGEVLAFLSGLGQPYLTDDSNADESFTRNRIRGLLLPLLRDEFNPRVAQALLRLGDQARATQDIVEMLAAQLLASAVDARSADQVTLRTESLRTASRHLVREAFRILFTEQHWPRQRMGFDDWDALAELAQTSQSPKSLTLPDGMRANFRRGIVTIERS